MGVNTRRTDGKSVQLVAPVDVEGGDPVVINGWHGIADTDAEAGDLVSVEIEPSVHELELANGTTGQAIGSVVYVHGTTAGANVTLDVTASGGTKFAKIVEIDGTNPLIVLGKLLENN
jgi:predicted RecA/RadA family phage recombinase